MTYISENQLSCKLVEFCKRNKTFREDFVNLFTGTSNIEDINFTGNTETGYGKPDITVFFKNGEQFYIEVKTRITTGFQENQVKSQTGYAQLIKKNNQNIQNSLGYLLDNNHDTTECLTKIIVRWQRVLELVKDFNNQDLAKDIIQSVDGIETGEKLFGSDEELFSNPYLLALYNDKVLYKEYRAWSTNPLLTKYLIPALKELGFKDVNCFAYGDTSQVRFEKEGKEVHITFCCFFENSIGAYYLNSFTFYRPWIIGVREATSERQLLEMTKQAVRLWLFDYEKNIKNDKCDKFEDLFSVGYLGGMAELYGNPILFANSIKYLGEGTAIYDDLVIPALKTFEDVKITDKCINETYRYIRMSYGDTDFKFNIFNFWNSKINTFIDYHSFIFYRPWIVGVHKAKNENELIEYTKQAFELWFNDLQIDNYL